MKRLLEYFHFSLPMPIYKNEKVNINMHLLLKKLRQKIFLLFLLNEMKELLNMKKNF